MDEKLSLPRLLIIEDERPIRERLRLTFESPPTSFRERYNINGFQVDVADTADAAQERLDDAVDHGRPYDIVWLDLGLPKHASDRGGHDPKVGVGLLKNNLDRHAWEAVIVASAYGHRPDVLLDLIRTRAVDNFIEKASNEWDRENEGPRRLVGEAYKRVQQRHRERIARERAENRLLQMRLYLAEQTTRVVSDSVGEVLGKINTLRSLLQGNTEQGAQGNGGRLWQVFDELQKDASSIVTKCRGVLDQCYSSADKFGEYDIGEIVGEQLAHLHPCWNGKWDLDNTGVLSCRVHTFGGDIRMIVQELLFGAIDQTKQSISDESQPRHCLSAFVRRSDDNLTVDVGVQETAEQSFDESALEAIEKGKPSDASSRVGGLALAQRAAHNIGAHIDVQQSAESGSLVVLHIPVTAND